MRHQRLISNRPSGERFGADQHVVGGISGPGWQELWAAGGLPDSISSPTRTSLPSAPGHARHLWGRSVDELHARPKPAQYGRVAAEISAVQLDLDRRYPDANRGVGIVVTSLKQQIVGDVKDTVLLLFGAVGLVLLIACANVASPAARARARPRVRVNLAYAQHLARAAAVWCGN